MAKVTVSTFTLATLFLSISTANAFERQHDAHVHGEASMNIAIEGGMVEAELKSPLANIVGFEHEATSNEDRQKLKQAIATLKNASAMIELPQAAKCQLVEAEVHVGGEAEHDEHKHDEEHHDHDDHKHEEHDHDDHAKHEEHHDHDEHKHEEHHDHDEHKHEEGAEHRDLFAHYHFNCATPAQLNQVKLNFTKAFPGMHHLDVNLLTDKGAQVVELDADTTEINF